MVLGKGILVNLRCLTRAGVRDKHRGSEIDLSKPRHEAAFWRRPNGPLTRYVTLRVAHATGMPGTLPSPPTPKETAS